MPFVIPESCELEDESLLFISDVLPTANWSIENSGIQPGDTVAVLFEDFDDMGGHIKEFTNGGVDVVIDCVGMDGKMNFMEKVEQKLKLQGGTLSAIDIGLIAVRKFGTIQLTGVYGSLYNMFPLGNIFERNVTLKMGQAPVIHYMAMLYDMNTKGEFDPKEIITHSIPLDKASEAYRMFHDHEEESIKLVLKP
ncbi:S-(hydroxymethyl)glutathione dehydrogenase / alcohol dehydrogenase [Psychrobacillus sp. OK032]|nr:S-(hydroxymethyl)glutathione dehydrogenase / alcohol dehydrogenase [Psychrobacillus sp. OK032]